MHEVAEPETVAPVSYAARQSAKTIEKRVLRMDRALVKAKRRGDERETARLGREIRRLFLKLEGLEQRAERVAS